MPLSPRYYVVAANLLLLAAVAYLTSSIVGTALAAKLAAPPALDLNPPPPPIEVEPPRPVSYYAVINKRDIFNSAPPAAAAPPVQAAVVTPLKLKLWGVAVHRDGHSYSIIEDLAAKKQGVYGIGDDVPGGATVKAVEWDRVILDHNGRDEILELAVKASLGTQKAAAPATSPAASAPAQPAAGSGGGIQATGENEYVVARSEVDSALENMSQLLTQVRAVPHFEGGTSVGFRLFAIRRGSLFDRIGLKNGDIITAINGNPMNDPGRAVAVLQELRDVRRLDVTALRNQQQLNLGYSIE